MKPSLISRNSQTGVTIIQLQKKYHSVVQCNGVSNIILTHKIMKSGTQLCLNSRSTMYHVLVYDFIPQFPCLYNGDDDNTL